MIDFPVKCRFLTKNHPIFAFKIFFVPGFDEILKFLSYPGIIGFLLSGLKRRTGYFKSRILDQPRQQ